MALTVLDALPARVAPITLGTARAAADVRARHGRVLRLPDALVVAMAMDLRADRLLTTDAGWPALDVRVDVIGPETQLAVSVPIRYPSVATGRGGA